MSELAERIEETLAPLIGAVLAKVTVEVEADRLGKIPQELSTEDLTDLSVNIERHLNFFVGTELAASAASKIRLLNGNADSE